jgi:hypothetical protein
MEHAAAGPDTQAAWTDHTSAAGRDITDCPRRAAKRCPAPLAYFPAAVRLTSSVVLPSVMSDLSRATSWKSPFCLACAS